MNENELKDQHEIMQSIYMQGGHARKWASRFQVGMPDLICSLPRVGIWLMEIKAIECRSIVSLAYLREFVIPIKDKQRRELEKFDMAGGRAIIGVVLHIKRDKIKRLFLCPWDAITLGENTSYTDWNGKEKCYDITHANVIFDQNIKGINENPL